MMLAALLLMAAAADSAELDRCMNSGDAAMGQTGAMVDCGHQEYLRHDAVLNHAYRGALQRSGGRRAALIQSERAWIMRRDAACRHHLDVRRYGTMGRLDYEACLTDQTDARTRWLDAWR